jgi:hypothetical protein
MEDDEEYKDGDHDNDLFDNGDNPTLLVGANPEVQPPVLMEEGPLRWP